MRAKYRGLGVVLFLFAWFCFGFDVFYSKTKEAGDKGIICSMSWRSKRLMVRIWLLSFLPVRILPCTHATGLPMQLRGSMDWGLQLIFPIGGHEEMGPDCPSKCLMFYEAFTALHILTVFYYFTVS